MSITRYWKRFRKVRRLARLIIDYAGTPEGAARIAEIHRRAITNALAREGPAILDREPTAEDLAIAMLGAQGWMEGAF